MNPIFYISALILGMGGSVHCIGMCGPLIISMPFQDLKHKNTALLLYLFSKAAGYGLLGVVVGSFGKVFRLFNWQQNLSILAGIALLMITILPYLTENLLPGNLSTNIVSKIYSNFSQKHPFLFFSLLGFTNALLPCGLIYTALAGAMITYSAWNGFVFMVLFGLGTMPVLLGLMLFKSKMNISFRNKLKNSSYYFSLAMAVLLIMRGMNLGIPYLSPEIKASTPQHKVEIKCCSKK